MILNVLVILLYNLFSFSLAIVTYNDYTFLLWIKIITGSIQCIKTVLKFYLYTRLMQKENERRKDFVLLDGGQKLVWYVLV